MMRAEIALKKCVNHYEREAVARCPECKRYYCRECVTEHEGKVLCASCLNLKSAEIHSSRNYVAIFIRTIQGLAGLTTLWLLFYYLGQLLLLIPTSFHEGTLWQK